MNSCKTLYPLLLVHGMGFRDGRISYWGRIPDILHRNGAEIYFGAQEANASVQRNAMLLAVKIKKILAESGAEKLNIIAHSKGGIEIRYVISVLGLESSIASLTTISTPHNGSAAMDKLMKLPDILIRLAAKITDFFKKLGGDKRPDTYCCFHQLTTGYMKQFNQLVPDSSSVLYQSCAFLMKNAFSDLLMCIPYIGVRLLNGRSDGFLTPGEVRHGQFLGVFTGTGKRGLSHLDEVDFRRRPLSKIPPPDKYHISDITQFYIGIVSDLKKRGL